MSTTTSYLPEVPPSPQHSAPPTHGMVGVFGLFFWSLGWGKQGVHWGDVLQGRLEFCCGTSVWLPRAQGSQLHTTPTCPALSGIQAGAEGKVLLPHCLPLCSEKHPQGTTWSFLSLDSRTLVSNDRLRSLGSPGQHCCPWFSLFSSENPFQMS